ncbi:LacI family DNA-binding transcriptional regulator [Algoriphagus namhaensis]
MPEKRRITLKDIAKGLGISVSTASRALNSYSGISEETIKMVKAYAEKHNYVPNTMAVNFRKNKTMTIGMIVPELVHYFFSSVISGALSEAKKRGYTVLVSQTDELLQNEIHAMRTMIGSSVDGVMISLSNQTYSSEHLQEFQEEGRPIVQFDKVIDSLDTPKVVVDDFEGAYAAVTHLIEQGFKKIAHLNGFKQVANSRLRMEGYQKALQDAGIAQYPDYIIHCRDISEEEGYQFTKKLMESSNPPDAIFCITDLVAMGAMNYLKDSGFDIPGQVGVVGFSNWDMANFVTPRLSSVDQKAFKIGEKACGVLIDMINAGAENTENKTYIIPTELKVRESSLRQSTASHDVS